jgi:hypothetical protein
MTANMQLLQATWLAVVVHAEAYGYVIDYIGCAHMHRLLPYQPAVHNSRSSAVNDLVTNHP